MDILREVVLPKFEGVQKRNGYWMVRCPVHEDRQASLSIAPGDTQPILLNCHAGCEQVDILAAVGLSWDDLCNPQEKTREAGTWSKYGPVIATYDYVDESAELLFQVCRTAKKQFPQRTPDRTQADGWRWTTRGVRMVPYRLPELIQSVKDGWPIYICEGEKDVHAIEAAGGVATCNPGGAGKWRDEYSEFLRDAIITVIADKDEPGQAHARKVAASLEGVACSVEIAEALGDCKDAADHFSQGHSIGDFEITWQSAEPEPVQLAPDLYEFISIVDPPSDWVIPGVLERGDRLIWTGFEGLGKSVFTRQLAVCAAAGVHPFTGEHFTPQRVLFIDCENPDRKSRRHFRKLEAIARFKGYPVPEGTLRILQRPAGVDLTRPDGAAWLLERVTAHQPDLVVCGPFYRLHATDTNEEAAARLVVAALDAARIKADCALVTEAHAGHGEGQFKRSVRPAGSSLLMRWPEFGYGIKPLGEADDKGRHRYVAVLPWRGPREEREWPQCLTWGSSEHDWPWVPYVSTSSNHLSAVS
jgi:hypothetical protein